MTDQTTIIDLQEAINRLEWENTRLKYGLSGIWSQLDDQHSYYWYEMSFKICRYCRQPYENKADILKCCVEERIENRIFYCTHCYEYYPTVGEAENCSETCVMKDKMRKERISRLHSAVNEK